MKARCDWRFPGLLISIVRCSEEATLFYVDERGAAALCKRHGKEYRKTKWGPESEAPRRRATAEEYAVAKVQGS